MRVSDDVGHDAWKMLRDAVRPNAPASPAVGDAIALVGLEHVATRKPYELPLGHQKLVGVARSLALRPKVLLLDEPAAGLDVAEIGAFGRRLAEIAATGVGCLLIDHDMRLVLEVCDRVYVIDFGRLIASGPDRGRASRPGGDRRLPRLRAIAGRRVRRHRDHATTGPQVRPTALMYVSPGTEPGGSSESVHPVLRSRSERRRRVRRAGDGHRRHVPGHGRHQLRRRGHGDGAAVRLQRPRGRPAARCRSRGCRRST